ncbi:MAG: NAD(P)/FAD-dependent oxidoreductase [Deltaproteobacteria bacterium]|nr:NAD(P)/FAD-dependent oxidoreductase [Deltaproteobacteria bacterium]
MTTPHNTTPQANGTSATHFDAVVVGAGFGGMYMLHKLRGLGFTARVYEAGGDVGGTWYWNRYPGARCDVPSLQYSYQFSEELQQEWKWTEKYSTQTEILRYANHVADRFQLRKDIQFNTRVTRATFDEATTMWRVETDAGNRVTARFCIMASGCLSSKNTPNFPGLSDFQGQWFHTSNWPHEGVDFTGKRVGIIGNGSTGIQAIPVIARQAEHLFVFQRTPQYSVPARNTPLDPEEEARIKARYRDFRIQNNGKPFAQDLNPPTRTTFEVSEDERRRRYEECWEQGGLGMMLAYADSGTNLEANLTVSAFVKEKIKQAVKDPAVAELLLPDHVYACKRPCLDTDYFETYNRPNVTLVDIRGTGIERITPRGVQAKGREYPVDCLVFATGFDAMTGALNNIDIRGKGHQALKDKWVEGPRCYLGLSSSGFPNLFIITGPGSPSVLANMIPAIEQHVNWVGDCLEYMRKHGLRAIEATEEAEKPWLLQVQTAANATLWNACDNWYQGSNVPGKPRVFMPYVDWVGYVAKCREVVNNAYEGFSLR